MSLGDQFDNILINTDNYKHCHYSLYPPGTEYISSYVESSPGLHPGLPDASDHPRGHRCCRVPHA
jgi:hypothetical protein